MLFDAQAKAGRRNSQADLDLLQEIHDLACRLGASCPEADYAHTHAKVTAMEATIAQGRPDERRKNRAQVLCLERFLHDIKARELADELVDVLEDLTQTRS